MNWDLLQTGEFYSTLCALLWAVAIVLFRKSGESVSPVALNLLKGLVGLALFLATMPIVGVPYAPPERTIADWMILLGSGALGIGVADTLLFISLNRLGAGRFAVIDCLYSPFVVASAFFYLGEPLGPELLVSVALMVGAILIGTWRPTARPTPAGRQQEEKLHGAVLIGVLAMLLMAVGIVMAKPVLDRADAWWSTAVRLAGGVAFLSVQGAMPRHRREVLRALRPSRSWLVTIPASVVGAYIAMFFWILGMKLAQTSVASILNQLSAVFVLIFATVFLRERLTLRKVTAILMGVAAGVLVAF